MGARVYIWGTGSVSEQYISLKEINENILLGFIESHKTKDIFFGKKVYEPYEIKNSEFDYILVCVYGKTRAIYQTALENNILPEKIVFVDNWEWIDGTSVALNYPLRLCNPVNSFNDIEKVKEQFPKLFDRFIFKSDMRGRRYIPVQTNGYELTHKDSVLRKEDFYNQDYWLDYFRYRSFELMANEIIGNGIQGAVAELGVFKGKFSRLINLKFPDRKLYLFDTFASFNVDEFEREMNEGRCEELFYERFKNTSEKAVLDIMPYPQNCVIKKGFFPDSVSGLEGEKYAFVSIDVDLKESILAGLRYFYPRLNEGGVIFLHDYNNYFLDGVREAVDIYEKEINKKLIKVPFADEGGTLVICKEE